MDEKTTIEIRKNTVALMKRKIALLLETEGINYTYDLLILKLLSD